MPARRELDAGGRVTFAKKRASPNGRTVEFGNTARYVTIAVSEGGGVSAGNAAF